MGKRAASVELDEEALAGEVNEALLEAVRLDDGRAVRRALEDGAHLWLGGSHCQSDDPEVNPALAALLSPGGPDALNGFQEHFGDLHRWSFGRWNVAHWAVAQKSEWALRWALAKGGPKLMSQGEEEGASCSRARRTPLALCAQMGDPQWLRLALAIVEESGQALGSLAKADGFSAPTALGTALFEMADAGRQGDEAKLRGTAATAQVLFDAGFQCEGGSRPAAAKLCVALALAHPEHPNNVAMGPAALLACSWGSGAPEGSAPVGPFEAAGLALDDEWLKANKACGMAESPEDCFGLGLSKRLLTEIREHGSKLREWSPKRVAGLKKEMERSLAAFGGPEHLRPLAGMEPECLLWLAAELPKQGASEASEAFRERVELGLGSAKAMGAKGPGVRL